MAKNEKVFKLIIEKIDPNVRLFGVNLIDRSIQSALILGATRVLIENNTKHKLNIADKFKPLLLPAGTNSENLMVNTVYDNLKLKSGCSPEESIISVINDPGDIKKTQELIIKSTRKKFGSRIYDYWFALPAEYLARGISSLPITPNQVTVAGFFVAIVSMLMFQKATLAGIIAGAILVQVGFVLDCADGRLARLRGTPSKLGAFLDSVLDSAEANLWTIGIILSLYGMGKPSFALVGLIALFGDNMTTIADQIGEKYSKKTQGGAGHTRATQSLLSILLSFYQFLSYYDIRLYLILIFALINRLDILVVYFALLFNFRWLCYVCLNWKKIENA